MINLNNVTTLDTYDTKTSLGPVPSCEQITYLVANNAVLAQLAGKDPSGTEEPWGDEVLIPPSTGTFTNLTGMRFRSAVAGSPAQVIAQLVLPQDPTPAGSNPYSVNLSPSGGISGGTLQRVTALPPGPADLAQVLLNLNAFYSGVEWLCTYNAATGWWDVIGAPITLETGGFILMNSAWQEMVSITPPNQGDYLVNLLGFTMTSGPTTNFIEFGTSVNAGVPTNIQFASPTTGNDTTGAYGQKLTIPAGGRGSAMCLGTTAAGNAYGHASLALTPYRIK